MTQGNRGNSENNRKKRRPYNKRRRGNANPNRRKPEQMTEKNGNVLEPENNSNNTIADDQSLLLPQSVTITASDYTQACQEAMMKLNIHDESLLGHEIVEKGKRNFLGLLGSRDITYKFFITPKYDVMTQNFIDEIIKLSFLDLSFNAVQQEGILEVDFEGEDEELLRSNGFDLLNSLEQLTRKHLIKKAALRPGFKIKFSVAGEVSTKEAKLESLASKMKEKAIKTKKIVTLNSMPPRDRRIIHQFFSEDEEIETRSHGDGYYKRIKLVPNNLEKRPPRKPRKTEENVESNENSNNEDHQTQRSFNSDSEKPTTNNELNDNSAEDNSLSTNETEKEANGNIAE